VLDGEQASGLGVDSDCSVLSIVGGRFLSRADSAAQFFVLNRNSKKAFFLKFPIYAATGARAGRGGVYSRRGAGRVRASYSWDFGRPKDEAEAHAGHA
jgi:hypothetical protein